MWRELSEMVLFSDLVFYALSPVRLCLTGATVVPDRDVIMHAQTLSMLFSWLRLLR